MFSSNIDLGCTLHLKNGQHLSTSLSILIKAPRSQITLLDSYRLECGERLLVYDRKAFTGLITMLNR